MWRFDNIAPMRIQTTGDIGVVVRARRKELALTQAAVASRAQVGREWLVGLEKGRPSADVGHILRVLHALDLTVEVVPAPAEVDGSAAALDAILDRHRL